MNSNSDIKQVGGFRPAKNLPPLSEADRATVERFSELYYRLWTEGRSTIDIGWLGYKTLKCPLDLWIYQELLTETRPDLIIECGTRFGGSAYYLACLCEALGHGRVVTIDIDAVGSDIDGTIRPRPTHARLQYVVGSSVDPQVVALVRGMIPQGGRAMAVLDSDHSRDHVLAELRAYAPLVAVGGYLIVEDSNINGHPALPGFGPGPWEAIDAFLAENDCFAIDADRERFLLTLNPRGYLQRLR